MPREECDRAYPGQITQNMVCAGDEKHGKDSCQVRTPGPTSCIAKDRDGQEETDTQAKLELYRDRLGENQRHDKGERLNLIHRNTIGDRQR